MKLIYKNKNLVLSNETKNVYTKISAFLKFNCKTLNLTEKIYKKRLFLRGLGYKCNLEKNVLVFKLNLSHIVKINIPFYITKTIVSKSVITFESYDKVLLGSFCEKVYRLRPVNIYQQKGFIISGKNLRTKEINKRNKRN